MPTPGPLELVIILVIALLILGPGKLPGRRRLARQEHPGVPQGVVRRPGSRQRDVDTTPIPPRRQPRRQRHRSPRRPRRAAERARLLRPTGPGRRRARSDRAASARSTNAADRRSPPASQAPSTRPWPTPTPCSSRASPGRPVTPDPDRSRRRGRARRRVGDVARRPPERAPHPAVPVRSWRSRSARSSGSSCRRPDHQGCSPTPSRTTSRCSSPGLGDAFVIKVKISLVVGIILAMPVLLYQVWAFIAPGLTPSERRTAGRGSRSRSVFFALGVGHRLGRPAVRDHVPVSFATGDLRAADHGRAVLRLRDDDVPGVRARDGVPDPAGRPVAGGHRHLGAAAPSRRCDPRHRDLRRGRHARRRPRQPASSAARCTSCSS